MTPESPETVQTQIDDIRLQMSELSTEVMRLQSRKLQLEKEREEDQRRKALEDSQRHALSTLERVPKFSDLYLFQQEDLVSCLNMFLNRGTPGALKGTLNANDTGTGKTAETAVLIQALALLD